MTATRDSHSIETFSGNFVSYDCFPPDIELLDIAHALSQICRYTGHTRKFYSVAEHAVRVAEKLAEWGCDYDTRLAGLHHDDAEAYLGDINKPLKDKIKESTTLYKELTAAFDVDIRKALGLEFLDFEAPAIKEADVWALGYEAFYLLPSQGFMWHDLTGGQYDPAQDLAIHTEIGWAPEFAEMMYLTLHRVLS